MAVVIKKRNHLKKDYLINLLISLVCGILTIISIALLTYNFWVFMILTVILGAMASTFFTKAKIVFVGLKGEIKANRIYRSLSDDYYIFNDINIRVDNKVSQIDNIIIGDNGVFIIEAKNINGYVIGTEFDQRITQNKIGKKGGEYSKEIYNPVKQVSTHVYRVSEYLKRNNIHVWVQGMVYFTNNECDVNIISSKIPIFVQRKQGALEIINYINTYKNSNSKLTEEKKLKIVDAIKASLNEKQH